MKSTVWATTMTKQLYEIGDVIQAGSNALEVTSVSYTEVDGQKGPITYSVRPLADLIAEREAATLSDEDDNIEEVPVGPSAT